MLLDENQKNDFNTDDDPFYNQEARKLFESIKYE